MTLHTYQALGTFRVLSIINLGVLTMSLWDRGAISSILQIRKHSVVSQDISHAPKMKRDKLYQLSRSIILGAYPSPLTIGGREGRETAWSHQDLLILASGQFPPGHMWGWS